MAKVRISALFVIVAAICGCSTKRDYRIETFPVKGEVYVDGSPAAELAITLHNVKGMDAANPTVSAGFTDATGAFTVSTFEQGDGVPEGEYVATFSWGKLDPLSMTYKDDKLKGRYDDVKDSQFKVTVKAGEQADMGRIELSTK